jgi:predicted nucleic acid-binding protein
VIAVDSSVAVAGLVSWHESHDAARTVLAERPSLPGHAAVETYSVLTRMPGGQRVEPALAERAIDSAFPDRWLTLDADQTRRALAELGRLGIGGGAVYDALIAIVARTHDAVLISLDRRAAPTYTALGVEHRLI